MMLLFWGMTMSVIGKGLLAIGIIWVHIIMAHERRIDAKVVRSFNYELYITLFGFALIIIGYILEIQALGGFSYFMTCEGLECVPHTTLGNSQ